MTVYGSSCKPLFFGLILPFFFLYLLYFLASHSALGDANKKNETTKEQKWDLQNRELHELPYTEMLKSGTIRLTTGYVRPSTPEVKKYIPVHFYKLWLNSFLHVAQING